MIKREKDRERIGLLIADLRRKRSMTQTNLAELTGLQRSHIVRIEQGKYGVTIDVLSQIAEALGCQIELVEF